MEFRLLPNCIMAPTEALGHLRLDLQACWILQGCHKRDCGRRLRDLDRVMENVESQELVELRFDRELVEMFGPYRLTMHSRVFTVIAKSVSSKS